MTNTPTPLATLISSSDVTFDDEFNSFTASSSGTVGWLTHLPFGGAAAHTLGPNNEAEYYADPTGPVDPFSINNGVLDITASVAGGATANTYNLPYNSGAISTIKSESQLYGIFEVRAELPAGAGIWPAFWLEPTNGLAQAELDVFEVLGNQPSTIYETTHNEVNGTFVQNQMTVNTINTSTGFHTYAVDWEPTTITWYIDGVAVNSAPTPSNMDTPMEMILNLAVGGAGSWPGAPTSASEFPATMQVDWVRAYASANTVDVTGTQTIKPGTGSALVTGQVLYSANGAAATAACGLAVSLVGSSGNVVASTTTNGQGIYNFTNLAAGTYQVLYTPPAGEVVGPGGPANSTTSQTASFTVATGQSVTAATETLITAPATIAGQVQHATTSTGSARSGIVVSLLSGSGAVLTTTTTDNTGSFAFTGLYAGSYKVSYGVPNGDTLAAGGAASTTSFTTGTLTAAVGQVIDLGVETIVPPGASLAGQVLVSGSGSSGVGQGGVAVALLNSTGSVVLTTTTNSTGNYLFTGLTAGTYATEITPPSGDVLALGGTANAGTGITAPVTLAAGQAVAQAAEQVLTQPATITGPTTFMGGGYWKMVGLTVNLLSSTGATLASTLTNGGGIYSFSDVAAGTYQLAYILPSNAKFYSGYENTTTGLSSSFTVSAGQAYAMTNVGVTAISGAFINGSVLINSGSGAAAGLAGVTVSMLTSTGVVLISTTTSSTGAFQFKGMLAGGYEIQYTLPSGDGFQAGGPANGTTGISSVITLTTGQVYAMAAQTLVPATSSLGGTVTYAGAADVGETVSLLSASGAALATATTNASGAYQFAGLEAGTYQLQFASTAAQIFSSGPAGATGLTTPQTLAIGQGVALAAETITPAPATLAGSLTFEGVAESGVAVGLLSASGTPLATATTDSSGDFHFAGLTAGSYMVQYSSTSAQIFASGPANASTGTTASVALTPGQTLTLGTEDQEPAPAALSGSVTYQGAADQGVAVSLLTAAGVTAATTTTDANGSFAFTGLAAGNYRVQYAATSAQMYGTGPANSSTGLTATQSLTPGRTASLANENLVTATATLSGSVQSSKSGAGTAAAPGIDVSLLSTTGMVVATTVTDNNGNFVISGISAGTYVVQYSAPGGGTVEIGGAASVATGQTAPISLTAGQTMAMATQQILTAPASISGPMTFEGSSYWQAQGMSVSLLSSTGATIATTQTNSSGVYTFNGVAAGTYNVLYTLPANASFYSGYENRTTGLSPAITVTAGQAYSWYNVGVEATVGANISGSVVYAANGAKAAAQAGVVVSLLNAAGSVVTTTTTSSSGAFSFRGLLAGTYQVSYATPSGDSLSAGGPATMTTGVSSPIVLSQGQTLTLATETLVPGSAVLAGSVQSSAGHSAPSSLAGVSVSLINAAGVVQASTVTSSSGSYQFTGLAAGTYQLLTTAPAGQSLELGSLTSPATGLSQPISLGAGQTVILLAEQMLAHPGSISGVVQHTGAGDPGTGQSGVSVALLNAAGTTIGTTTTSGTGAFSFGNLAAGSYQLLYTTPSGEAIAAGSAANPSTGLSAMLTLGAAASLTVASTQLTSSSNIFTLSGTGATAARGAGNYVVTGNAANGNLTLGAGNQSVALTGGGDTITVGAGGSTISALGGGNLIHAGAGMNFITTDASAGNVFALNGNGQGVTTINGFNTGSDVLDLKTTLAGLPIASNFSNLGNYLTASVSNGNTTLAVDPTPGAGTPYGIAVLNGVTTSVAQLITGHAISLS